MDEDAVKPCIQNRLRSIYVRSEGIIEFIQIICLTIIVLMFIVIPEILPIIYGRKVEIPIFSQISLEGRFGILISIWMAFLSSNQYKMNKSIFRIEQRRSQPFLYAKISSDKPRILIENSGGGIAWGCIITLSRGDIDEFYEERFEEIYPFSGEEMEMPVEWQTQSFDLCVEIDYYRSEDIEPEFKEHWQRIYRKIKPFYDY